VIFGDAGTRPTLKSTLDTRILQLFPVRRQLSAKPPRKITPVSIMSPVTANRMTKPMSIILDSEVFLSLPNFYPPQGWPARANKKVIKVIAGSCLTFWQYWTGPLD
jgi:hypothetical protein